MVDHPLENVANTYEPTFVHGSTPWTCQTTFSSAVQHMPT
jgi:hypothetical protein